MVDRAVADDDVPRQDVAPMRPGAAKVENRPRRVAADQVLRPGGGVHHADAAAQRTSGTSPGNGELVEPWAVLHLAHASHR